MRKSVVATAQAGYEQINSAAKRAVDAAETSIAKVSEQSTQAAKAAAK